ncbi:MAG: hypothetical protein AAF382_05270 [Pseudomonadota bacterium]|mgnify:FL=1
MSDYEQSRYSRASYPVDTGGASAFWVLVVVVALGALVLIMAIGGAATGPIEGTTGAETAPAITPAEPEPSAATGTLVE